MKHYTDEPTTVGLSNEAHEKLKLLKENQDFGEMADAYRFAIALALSRGAVPVARSGPWTTVFNVGSLDPDGSLFASVQTLRPSDLDEPVWKTAERLADWGVEELHALAQAGSLSLADLLSEAAEHST